MPSAETILVVEDHADTSAALCQILMDRGYAVVTADDGQQALDYLERGGRPGLILIDLMLPAVSGWDLLNHLRSDPELREIPTIVVTAIPKDQVRVIADAVFSKPVEFARLAKTVDRLIGRQQ